MQAQAASIRAEQFRDVLAKLIDAGKGRTAAKLRAYLRAAYSMAMRAGLDPTVPAAFSAFGVEVNQLERLPSLSQFSKALDRALTLPELRLFWERLQKKPEGAARDAISAALMLGGQRPRQLLRATAADVDETAGTIVPPLIFLACSLWLGLAAPSFLRETWQTAAELLGAK